MRISNSIVPRKRRRRGIKPISNSNNSSCRDNNYLREATCILSSLCWVVTMRVG